jgi:hypothetical protein
MGKIYEDRRGETPQYTIILVGLLVVTIIAFLWAFIGYRKAESKIVHLSTREGQVELTQKEVQLTVTQVSAHMILPVDEQPLLATIEDVEQLKTEAPFYENAQNGDRLLVYRSKAIIYSPARDIIVNVGPVQFVDEEAAQENARAVTPSAGAEEPRIVVDERPIEDDTSDESTSNDEN